MNGGGKGGSTDPNRIDDILTVLSDPARRDLIQCLVEGKRETMTLDELAEDLMARWNEDGYDGKRAVEMRLQHFLVPKLAEHNVVEYDPREGRVRYRGDSELETWLDNIREWEEI